MFKYVIISCVVFSACIHAGKTKLAKRQPSIVDIKKTIPRSNNKQSGPSIVDAAADGANAIHLQNLPGKSAAEILYMLTGNRT